MESIRKYINNNELMNRSKVVAILKDIICDEVKINKLMLAYDLKIVDKLNNDFNISDKKIFVTLCQTLME